MRETSQPTCTSNGKVLFSRLAFEVVAFASGSVARSSRTRASLSGERSREAVKASMSSGANSVPFEGRLAAMAPRVHCSRAAKRVNNMTYPRGESPATRILDVQFK
jgi:hypothetical protein